MGTIATRKLKDGTLRFRAEIRINRKDSPEYKESKTFNSRRIAENWLKKREDEIRENPQILLGQEHKPLTINEVVTRYLDEVGKEYSRSKNNTLKLVKKFPIAKKITSKLNAVDLANHAALRKEGIPRLKLNPVSPSTIQSELGQLRSVLAHAKILWGLEVDLDEFDKAMSQLRKSRQISASQKRDRLPTSDELKTLLEHFTNKYNKRTSTRYPMHYVILFAIFSCRRESEITRLELTDYNKAHEAWLVRDLKNPKGKGFHREFDVLEPCQKIIDIFRRPDVRLRMLRTGLSDKYLVPLNPKTIAKEFNSACKLLNIEDLRFHDLRHEGCTRLAEQDFTIPKIQQVSLHGTWSNLQRYVSVKKRVNVLKFEELLSIIGEA